MGLGGIVSSGIAMAAARKARQWQEKMYKNRYQYTMKDMRAAGLNPMLAYKLGVSGGVPSGAMANIPSMGAERIGGKKVKIEKQVASANVALMAQKGNESRAVEAKEKTAAQLNSGQLLKVQQDTMTSAAQAKNLEMQTLLGESKVPRARAMQAFDETVGRPLLEQLQGLINTGKESFGLDGANRRMIRIRENNAGQRRKNEGSK